MARTSVRDEGWRLPDELWARMEPLLPPRPAHRLGCHNPRVPGRAAMDAIFFVLRRTGCRWDAPNATGICSSSLAHRRFQEWAAAGVFHEFWRRGLLAYEEAAGIDGAWLALDGAMGKAPLGGGEDRPEPDGQGQERQQALAADGQARRPARPRGRWRQPERPQTDAREPGSDPGRAA